MDESECVWLSIREGLLGHVRSAACFCGISSSIYLPAKFYTLSIYIKPDNRSPIYYCIQAP